jgi:hypothetical protein
MALNDIIVPKENSSGKFDEVVLTAGQIGAVSTSDSRLTDSRTPTSHTHGNLTNAGAIGTTANLPLITGTNGVIEAGSFGTSAGSFCAGDDARLSDDRDPNLHAASHLPDGADEIFDQSLDKSDDVEFATVGIGDTPTGSERKFHQHGGKFTVESSSGSYGQFQIVNPNETEISFVFAAGSSCNEDGTLTTDNPDNEWAFGAGTFGFTPDRFTIGNGSYASAFFFATPEGNIGIRQSNPTEALHVAGKVAIEDTDSNFKATFDAEAQLSDDVTLTIPDQSGTLAVVTDIPTEVTDLSATGISADYVPVAQGDGTIVWEAQSGGGGGGDTVSIQTTAADILSVSSGAISADDAGADRIVYWNNTSNKLAYGTPSDVGAAASSHTHSDATQSVAGFLSTADKTKLDGIASGAEVNVNADWSASSGDAQILNKPTLGTAAAAATTDFAAASHAHAASAITSGTLDVARLPVGTGSTQVAAGNHTHVVADVTGAAASGSITTSGLTQATARILGRTSSSAGSIEEIQIGSGLSLSAGELSATSSGGISAVGASTADVLSVSGSDLVADDPNADRIVFWDDSEGKLRYLEAGSGLSISGTTMTATASGGSKTYAVFTAEHNQPPATAFATLDTRNSIAVLDFDDATDESAVFVSIIPEAASLGSGLKIRLHWMATTATSGNVVWDVSLERMTTDLDSDSFDTIASGTAAANGTSGILTVTEITLTTIDSVTAGDGYRLKVTRDANNASDTMTGDAELVVCEVRSAA